MYTSVRIDCIRFLCRMMVICFVCFFFQAEDGIRDLVRSRGLGDVYKRQTYRHLFTNGFFNLALSRNYVDYDSRQSDSLLNPVSYTHLTLPTSDLV